MANIIHKTDYIQLLNTDSNVMMYYSKRKHDFVPLVQGERIPRSCVEVPFEAEVNAYARKKFWYDLGYSWESCPGYKGFHARIRDLDLTDEYYEFERSIVIPYMNAWAKSNDISINWSHYAVI